MKLKRKLSLSLLGGTLCAASSCSVEIPNVTLCAVAGSLKDGAACAETSTDVTRDLTFSQFLDFLEPKTGKGAAICLSSQDYGRIKTAIDQVCKKTGACSYEVKARIEKINSRVERVQKGGKS